MDVTGVKGEHAEILRGSEDRAGCDWRGRGARPRKAMITRLRHDFILTP